MPPVAGGVAVGAAVGPKLWKFLGETAKKMKGRQTAAKLARELAEARDKGQEVRDVEALDNLLEETQRRNDIHLLRHILTEQARNPGILTETQVEDVEMAESGGESIWSGEPLTVRMIVAVRIQIFVDMS